DPRMLAYGAYTHASMAAEFVVETERWDAAERLLPATQGKAKDPRAALAQTPAIFAHGLTAALKGSPDAQASVAALRAIREQPSGTLESAVEQVLKMSEIHELKIAAVASASTGNVDEAITIMQKATALEEAMGPPSGPPIKPSHELYGELLLRAGRHAEAAQQFSRSLFRHPNRARSLLGAARAAAQQESREAAVGAYAKFLQQWKAGDAQLPEIREAQEYTKRAVLAETPKERLH
ncbi:MAG: hypothetical protein ACT4OO_15540, partial [Nitrospiraceae bacterium]